MISCCFLFAGGSPPKPGEGEGGLPVKTQRFSVFLPLKFLELTFFHICAFGSKLIVLHCEIHRAAALRSQMKGKMKHPMKRGPKPKKKNSRKLGKAATLPGRLWAAWVQHVLCEGRCWLYMALVLSHVLCLRITECLKLRAEDFSFKASTVYIGPLKRQEGMRKPLVPEIKTMLLKFKRTGVSRKRTENKGSRGRVTWWDRWRWPETGLLFPADRMDCATEGRNKDAVCKAIVRLRAKFEEATDRPIRSHSGRQTMVNTLKAAGLADDISMYYARISDKQTFHGYGSFTPTQANEFIKKSKELRKSVAHVYASKFSKKSKA